MDNSLSGSSPSVERLVCWHVVVSFSTAYIAREALLIRLKCTVVGYDNPVIEGRGTCKPKTCRTSCRLLKLELVAMARHLISAQRMRIAAACVSTSIEVREPSRDRCPRPAEERRGRGGDVADVYSSFGVCL